MSAENTAKTPSLLAQIVMMMAGIPATMCFTTLGPVLPKMEAALAHGPNDQLLVKMVVGVGGISMLFGSPLSGFLADKIGRAPIIGWSLLMAVIFGCAGYFIDDLQLMVLSRFILGLAAATSITAAVTMIGDIPDETLRRRLMGIYVSVGGASAIVTVPLAGLLADHNWRWPFLLFLIFFPAVILAKIGLKEDFAKTVRERTAEQKAERFAPPYGMMALGLVAGTTAMLPVTYVPFRLRDLGISSSAQIGYVMTGHAAALVVLSLAFGFARKHISSAMTFVFSFGFSALGLCIVALTRDFAVAAFGTFIIGVGVGWLPPNTFLRAAESATAVTRGRVLGFVRGVYLSAAFVSVLTIEPIFRAGGAQAVLLTLMAISAIAAAAFFYNDRKYPQPLTAASGGVGSHH